MHGRARLEPLFRQRNTRSKVEKNAFWSKNSRPLRYLIRSDPKPILIPCGPCWLAGGLPMFEKERFIEDCRAALKEKDVQGAIRELVERTVREPAAIVRGLGEPTRSG